MLDEEDFADPVEDPLVILVINSLGASDAPNFREDLGPAPAAAADDDDAEADDSPASPDLTEIKGHHHHQRTSHWLRPSSSAPAGTPSTPSGGRTQGCRRTRFMTMTKVAW